jgi:hypothetical protein
MFKSLFFGNPFGRSCFALAQQIERGLETRLDKKAQNDVLMNSLLVHMTTIIKQFLG